MSMLDPTLSYRDFKNVDMVIEAVFEDIKIKHAVIKEVEQVDKKNDADFDKLCIFKLINFMICEFCLTS